MNRIATTAALLFATALAVPSHAATITFTGNETDFTSQGVVPIVDDGTDTQTGFCSPGDEPLDLGRVYVTNDATNLYIGVEYNRSCFCDINLLWAFHVRPGGSVADPFGRQIDWSTAAEAPDFYVYDVIPTNCNGFNYEVLYEANGGGGWNTLQDGGNGLNIFDADGGNFVELAIPLSRMNLGCTPSNFFDVFFEIGVTQEGGSKPAFDLVANDGEQRSVPGNTCFDVGPCGPSKPTSYLQYRIDCPVPAEKSSWGGVKALYRL